MGEKFIKRFGVPEPAAPYVDLLFSPAEVAFVEAAPEGPFTAADVAGLVEGDAAAFLDACYRRGVVSLAPAPDASAAPDAPPAPDAPAYVVANFYARLDVACVSEQEAYGRIPAEARRAIDAWYFDAYYQSLDPDPAVRPTQDRVLTLQETLDLIDADDRPVYLGNCDCRSLGGDCGLPTRTCLSYRVGPNTFADRGVSERVSKERAKQVVRDADRAGLMHTANPNGICNCCGDCCYLFRSQRRRGSQGFWPESPYVISFDAGRCVGCGRCVQRCHFGVFSREGRAVTADTSTCVGCGICANTCPAHALELVGRSEPCPAR